MKKTNITKTSSKELLNVNSAFLKGLNILFNYNYNKPYQIYKINSNFTFNQVKKEAEKDGYTTSNSLIITLLRIDKPYHTYTLNGKTYKQYKTVKVTTSGFDLVDKTWCANCRSIDNDYSKSNIEEIRKNKTCEGFVICQKLTDINDAKSNVIDFNTRYKLVRADYSYSKSNRYYHSLQLKDCNNKDIAYRFAFSYTAEYTDINNIIDKNGFVIIGKKNTLKNNAKKIKAERQKNIYNNVDNSSKILILKNRLDQLKKDIIGKYANANTYDEMKKYSDLIGRYNGLTGLYFDIELLINRDNEKKYSSVESFENAYNDILAKIEKIENEGMMAAETINNKNNIEVEAI